MGVNSLRAFVRSFEHAFAGFRTLLRTQPNARIHACVTVAVIATGLIAGVSPGEWCLLVLAIMVVWTAEAFNTALEFLADAATPEFHPLVKQAKDVATGAVLISAAGAVVIGALVFGPHLEEWIK